MKNIILILALVLMTQPLSSKEEEVSKGKSTLNPTIHCTAYLHYRAHYSHEKSNFDDSEFKIGRAYFGVKNQITPYLKFRITLDVYEDDDGIEERLKYLYAAFHIPDFAFWNDSWVEFGLSHTPWLMFEQNVNYYRMQGTMFMERAGIFNSADFGFNWQGLIGGKMSEDYRENVNSKLPGRYGSFSLGFFNGAGYSVLENNPNKTLQSRVTLRPLPDIVPGLQLSWSGIFGQGNLNEKFEKSPNWELNAGMLSYENEFITLTGQVMAGQGDRKGKIVDDNGNSIDYSGYSLFGETRIGRHFKLMARYDYFNPERMKDKYAYRMMIAGIGYDFYKRNMLLLDFQNMIGTATDIYPETSVTLTTQINF